MADEVESLEMLLGEILVRFKRVEAEAIDQRVFAAYMLLDDTQHQHAEIAAAMTMCKSSHAFRPHLLLDYVRGHAAAESALATLAQQRVVHGTSGTYNLEFIGAQVHRAVVDLEGIVAELRDMRETYLDLAHQRT